jgi:hypothetical protein
VSAAASKFPGKGAFNMGQLDKACSVDFLRRYFVSLFEESPMSNRLSMDKTQGITQRFAFGMSQR